MSKKSRKRNKKILAAIGIGLGAAALASKKNKSDLASTEDGKSGSTKITGGTNSNDYDSGTKKKPVTKKTTTTTVSTPTTVMDSMPTRPKLNEKSIRVKDGKVFTIEGAKAGVKPKISGIDTPGIAVNDRGNITAGGKQFYDKNQYKTRNDKPGMLGDSGFTRRKSVMANSGINRMSDDMGFKSGGRVKGCGIAKRGLGRAMKKGKR